MIRSYTPVKGGMMLIELFPSRIEISLEIRLNKAQLSALNSQQKVKLEADLRQNIKLFCHYPTELLRFDLNKYDGRRSGSIIIICRLFYEEMHTYGLALIRIQRGISDVAKRIKDAIRTETGGIQFSRNPSPTRKRVRASVAASKELIRESSKQKRDIGLLTREIERLTKRRQTSRADNAPKGKKRD